MTHRAGGETNDSLAPDFLDFIASLNAHAVDCVLVGGYALAVYGVVRATGDIDFLYRREADNVRRLCGALEEFGAPPNVIDFDALMMPYTVTMFGSPPYRIDLLSDITGVDFDQVWAGTERVVVQDQVVRVIGPSELLANKEATGRKKDATDLRRLRAAAAAEATPTATVSAADAGERGRSKAGRRRSVKDATTSKGRKGTGPTATAGEPEAAPPRRGAPGGTHGAGREGPRGGRGRLESDGKGP